MATGRSRAPRLKKIRNLSKKKSNEQNWPVEGQITFPEYEEINCKRHTSKDGKTDYFKCVLKDDSGEVEMIAFGKKFVDVYEDKFKENMMIRIKEADLDVKHKNFKYILNHAFVIKLNRNIDWVPAKTKGKPRSDRSRSAVKTETQREASELQQGQGDTEQEGRKKGEREGSTVKIDNDTETKEGATVNTNLPALTAPKGSDKNKFKQSFDGNLTQTNMELLAKMMKSVGAVMGVSPGSKRGTCFRVGNKHVVTAYHVIEDIHAKNPNKPVKVIFDEYLTYPSRVYLASKCEYLQSHDVAVLEIDEEDGLPIPLKYKCIFDDKHVKKVGLIGFGNRSNPECKQFETCKVIPKTSNEIEHANRYVNKVAETGNWPYTDGYKGWNLDHTIIVSCWQEHGASGAPLIDVTDSGCPRVVGMLTHGLPSFAWDLDETMASRIPENYRFEVGTTMTSIMNWLSNAYPETAKSLQISYAP